MRDTFANVISTNLATSVNLSQIALQRSKNREVLEFARRIHDGETRWAEQLLPCHHLASSGLERGGRG